MKRRQLAHRLEAVPQALLRLPADCQLMGGLYDSAAAKDVDGIDHLLSTIWLRHPYAGSLCVGP